MFLSSLFHFPLHTTLNSDKSIKIFIIHKIFQDSEGAYYWHITSGTIQRDPPGQEDSQVEPWNRSTPQITRLTLQDQVSNLIRNVRSSRIFDSSSFESDFAPGSSLAGGMQKSCTASSIVDLGEIIIRC